MTIERTTDAKGRPRLVCQHCRRKRSGLNVCRCGAALCNLCLRAHYRSYPHHHA